MRYFPIFLDLKDRTVIVVGGGEEGLRKIRLLSRTGARIAIIAEALHDEIAANPRVEWLARRFEPHRLDGAALVVSAEATLNEAVSAAAHARGIPVNAVDRADLSDFIVPSIVDRSPVVVAIGTEGMAPMLGQGLRARIDAMLPQALGRLAEAAALLRDRVASSLPTGGRRRSFWQRFFFGDVRDSFIAGETENFASGVEALFVSEKVPVQGRVSFVDAGAGDPELLTLKAQRKLLEADVIVHDRSLSPAILEMARRDATRMPVISPAFTSVASLLIREAGAGRRVVRLRAGETIAEELMAVAAEGLAIETVPGISTAPAAIVSFPIREDIRDAILRAAS
ncbi:MAG: hypothetical protein HY245_12820 [Rhizobiales bacterium]|nr:hypothetical protein [Hyphomicrobiales bacterium]